MKGKAKIVGDGSEVEVTYRVPVDHGPRPAPRPSEQERVASEKEKATHAPGFSSVNWFGIIYRFTKMQALVVASLWQAWKEQEGDGAIHQDALLADADSDQQKLRDLFDRGGHAAWGTLIVPALGKGGQRGCYMLNVPADYREE